MQFKFDLPEPDIKQREAPADWKPFDAFPELSGVVALDLETHDPGIQQKRGSSWAIPGEGHPCGFSIARRRILSDNSTGRQGFYCGTQHAGGNVDVEKALRWLKAQASKPDVTFCYANAIYDLGWILTAWGIDPVNAPIDVQGMAALLDEQRSSYSLDSLMRDYLKRGKTGADLNARAWDIGIPNAMQNMRRLPTWIVEPYAVDDAIGTLDLYHTFLPMLEEQDLMRVFELERECLLVGRDLKHRGVRVDTDAVRRMKELFSARRDDAIRRVFDATGVQISPDDKKAIARALQVENPSLVMETTATGQVAVRAGILDGMATPVSLAVREAKKMNKAISTFIEGYFERFTNAQNRIHAEFHPLRRTASEEEGGGNNGTVTGRWSCVAPWTPVETMSGPKRIDAIRTGDVVRTHKERWRKVTATWLKGREDMLSFTFSNGNILTCTKMHRFMLDCGEWITAGELYERFKVVDEEGRERSVSAEYVSQQGLHDNARDRERAGDDIPERAGSYKGSPLGRGAEGLGISSLLCIEVRGQEPYEGQSGAAASELEGRNLGREGVPDNKTGIEETKVIASPDGRSFRIDRAAITLRGSSYRQQPLERHTGQLRSCNSEGSQDYSCPAETRAPPVQITSIKAVGSYEVHDITVEEDESYLSCGVFSHNSSNPNLTNIPARDPEVGPAMRRCFLPEEGERWAKFDYSAQEPRLAVHFAHAAKIPGAQEMVDRFNADPMTDLHAETAAIMGVGRGQAKIINLAILYGAGGGNIAEQLGLPTEIWESPGGPVKVAGVEAKALIAKHAASVPWVKGLQQLAMSTAERRGYVKSILGRRQRFNRAYADGRLMGTHKALNSVIQPSAADQMKSAQVKLRYYGYNPLVVVHDEADFSIPEGVKGEVILAEIREIMEAAIKLSVPSVAEASVGLTWGDV